MADPRGFLKYERIDTEYRPVDERIKDFKEVLKAPNDELIRSQALRCMDCGVPFCQSDFGCPLGNLIPEWNDLATQGRWSEALQRLHATNNFPEFTARLCPAPCESSCVLGLNGEAVTIKSIERRIIDRGYELGLIKPLPSSIKTGKRIAIIGSGPAGLAAAQELARMGHAVTVFEKESNLGGLLRYGIPDFKMEKYWIESRIRQMQVEGVEFKTGVCVGRDISFAELRSSFHAIGLAIGAEQPRDLKIKGRELSGIHFAMDYLTDQNRVIAGEKRDLSINAKDKTVVIIGGGDTGSDCIGTAVRQGAKEVYQFEILARPSETRPSSTPWPQWPMVLRSSHAHEEGAIREWTLSATEFVGDESGRVVRIEAERVALENGKFQAVPNSKASFGADLVILAMGFAGPMQAPLLRSLDLEYDSRGLPKTDSNLMSSQQGIFVAGDARRGASLIVWAIAEGRKMANGINHLLNQTTLSKAHKKSITKELEAL